MKTFVVLATFVAIQAQAQIQLTSETYSQLQKKMGAGKDELDGTYWKLEKEYCVTSTSSQDMNNPVRDLGMPKKDHYFWNFKKGRYFFQRVMNYDVVSCYITEGTYGYAEIPGGHDIQAVLATTTEQAQRINFEGYDFPVRLNQFIIWKNVQHKAFLNVSAIEGTENRFRCPSVNNFLVREWKKFEKITPP